MATIRERELEDLLIETRRLLWHIDDLDEEDPLPDDIDEDDYMRRLDDAVKRARRLREVTEIENSFDPPICDACGGLPLPLTVEDIPVVFHMARGRSGGLFYTGVHDIGDSPEPTDTRARCADCGEEWPVVVVSE